MTILRKSLNKALLFRVIFTPYYEEEIKYENEDDAFTIRYYYSENSLSYDGEKGKVYIININGGDGYLVEYLDGTFALVWRHNDAVFTVAGNLSSKELLKIAENIS